MKMRSLLTRSGFVALAMLIAFGVGAQQEKVIEKSFKVSSSALVAIKNSFGRVQVTSWEEPTVALKVKIEVKSLSDSREAKLLEDIAIRFDEEDYRLSIETDIDIQTRGKESFQVDYEVKVPVGNKLKVSNSFGDIYIDDREAEVEVELSYGDLKIGNLDQGGELRISFGEGEVGRFASGYIDLRYCDYFSIESAENLILDQQFSDVEIGATNQIELESRYGSLEIAEVNVLESEVDFTNVIIEKLGKSLRMRGKYASDFTVEEVAREFDLIDIRGEFGSYTIDLEEGLSAKFYGDFEYADLRTYGVDIDFTLRRREDNHNQYEGNIGDGQGGVIKISSLYGGLRLSQ